MRLTTLAKVQDGIGEGVFAMFVADAQQECLYNLVRSSRFLIVINHRTQKHVELRNSLLLNIASNFLDIFDDKTYTVDDNKDYDQFLAYEWKTVRAWEAKDGKMIFYILPPKKKDTVST